MKTDLEIARERLSNIENGPKTKTHSRMFLLDTSGSMLGFKLEHAKRALNTHIKPGDGIITFDSSVHYVIKDDIGAIFAGHLTAMLPAIKEAIKYKCSHIILITDGMPNVDGETADVTDFVLHQMRGIRIDSIGIGNDCQQEFLNSISKCTNGTSFHIDDPEQLSGVVGLLTSGSSINL